MADTQTAKTIDPQHAADLYDSEDGETVGPWARVGDQLVSAGRWTERRWLVVSDEDGHEWGVPYEVGLTESQEIDLPWDRFPDRPLTLTRLYPHEVTRIEYRTEPLSLPF